MAVGLPWGGEFSTGEDVHELYSEAYVGAGSGGDDVQFGVVVHGLCRNVQQRDAGRGCSIGSVGRASFR